MTKKTEGDKRVINEKSFSEEVVKYLQTEMVISRRREFLSELIEGFKHGQLCEDHQENALASEVGLCIKNFITLRQKATSCTVNEFLKHFRDYVLISLFPPDLFPEEYEVRKGKIERYYFFMPDIGNQVGEVKPTDMDFITQLLNLGSYDEEKTELIRQLSIYQQRNQTVSSNDALEALKILGV
ncbi:MAG: hypothetical protein V1838_05065 [Patescibacteria group bacterium]